MVSCATVRIVDMDARVLVMTHTPGLWCLMWYIWRPQNIRRVSVPRFPNHWAHRRDCSVPLAVSETDEHKHFPSVKHRMFSIEGIDVSRMAKTRRLFCHSGERYTVSFNIARRHTTVRASAFRLTRAKATTKKPVDDRGMRGWSVADRASTGRRAAVLRSDAKFAHTLTSPAACSAFLVIPEYW
jgi:hypothetical protein